MASRGADRHLDISPKGDPAGFVAVLDEKTLAIPDRLSSVTVAEVFLHCPKCMARSRLWNAEHLPNRSRVPVLAEAIIAHAKPDETVADVQAVIVHGLANLY